MPLSLRSPLAALPVIAATLAFGATSAHAAGCDVTYDGPSGGTWDLAANWTGDALPTAAQDVCVPSAAGTVTVPAGTTAHALLLTAQARLAIPAGATLAIADATSSAAHLSALGPVDIAGTLSTAGSWIDLDGDTSVTGLLGGPGTALVRLQSGTLTGTGEIDPGFNAFGGTVAPGGVGTVGTLVFGGLFSEQPTATVVFDLASDSSFDQIEPINNNGFFGGVITANLLGSYHPPVGTSWNVGSLSPGFDNFGWTVGPAPYFKAQAISHGLQIWLDQALPDPAPPAGGGGTATTGGGTTTTTSTGTSTTPVTTTPPPPAASAPAPLAAASLPAAAQRLLLGCADRRLVLDDVLEQNGRVALSGTAALDLVGRQVQILFGDRAPAVATATVAAGGVFQTTAPLPAAKVKNTNNARYVAVADGQRSLDLKLQRRLILAPPRRTGASVTLTGQVTRPLARPKPQPVTVAQQTACGRWTTVKTFIPNKSTGKFTVTVPAPAGTAAAIYRLQTAVPKTTKNAKAYKTFSLPEPVLLAAP